ncbi:uncharacterized protein K452DRAFT_258283 [Aplosporella prunicola CBS 121167]|uniref:Formin GTPase-binding domain-containing protein n=1 Tax=Aplosporella prunicola CBS 121167 TaxID=1176127 RepID=A0A6A6B172_9PEZI|nr:uncharacterized protein K452DRAFT_258283 [Aplosporella prunicola CBS 121167]KAF2137005.1 hypothetical protein K452DRAFT_258283 [Aplosporella prunicola CBS 121167]
MDAVPGARLAVPHDHDRPSHRRNKSATTIKSFLTGRGHKRSPSDGTTLTVATPNENARPRSSQAVMGAMPLLPPDHPHGQRVLGELYNQMSNAPASPKKSDENRESKRKSVHKKTLSAVSLRSLARGQDKPKEEKEKEVGKEGKREERREEKRMSRDIKKTKSSTSLSAVFAKAKQRKENNHPSKDKENTTPPHSAVSATNAPIWAEFSTQRPADYQETTSPAAIPPRDRQDVDNDIALYTPTEYTPSKQRNFYDFERPTLQISRQTSGGNPRPSSMFSPKSGSSTSFLDTLSRKISDERKQAFSGKAQNFMENWKMKGDQSSRPSNDSIPRRSNSDKRKYSEEKRYMEAAIASKRGSRVMAAVAAINGRAPDGKEIEAPLDQEKIDAEFEAVLDSRNIPENLREKMRSLNTRVKADFISKNKIDEPQPPFLPPKPAFWDESRPAGRRTTSDNSNERIIDDDEDLPGTKRRPRSKTFTFSRADKGEKGEKAEKQKPDTGGTLDRSSYDTVKSASSKSLASSAGPSFFSRAPKAAVPEEFVAYLRQVQKPEEVEVGKIHKLRLLLRNETVAWVDSFIRQGGMMEIVGLLHRIMQIEWREEHEDTLLHESLLCLKGLCTTDLALQKLCEIESTLFPALLAMLFDEEHKGPSEFTTRGLIMSLLFAHLSSAAPPELPDRARTILNYLKDPQKPEQARPVPFILEMYESRPYRVWHREISNVTKEVFWIFLHHLNIIPLLPQTSGDGENGTQGLSYAQQNFPQPRPPVPAAPYVGGVEWDATNYIATHLDLLNGLIASLPTVGERNTLRAELRASKFEITMGGALRTCKEKFYGAVHDGLRTWVKAAAADGWEVKDVRLGPKEEPKVPRSPSPKKKEQPPPKIETPKIELPSLNLGVDLDNRLGEVKGEAGDDYWL